MCKSWDVAGGTYLRNALPERVAEIDGLLQKHRISLWEDETESRQYISVQPHPQGTAIHMTTIPVRRQWMHAYAHIVRYAAAENGEPDSSVIVAPVSSQTKADAEALLNLGLDADAEAVNNLVDVGLRGFPEHLPEPLHSCRDPHHALATEMTAFMIAYMLLHEIAHLELNHTPNNGRKQEVAADEWARRFFLERCDDHEDSIGCEHGRVREKRLLGLVIGHLWLISHDIAFGIPGDGSHPRACDRLSTLLGNSGVDANGLPWFIAMSGLEIYCRRLACLSLPRNYSSFREGYNSLVGSLTRAHWR